MLDIRIPIGLLFTVLGILLSAYGIYTNAITELYSKSFQITLKLLFQSANFFLMINNKLYQFFQWNINSGYGILYILPAYLGSE